MKITDWLETDDELLKRIDRELALVEREEYIKNINDRYKYGGRTGESYPIEMIAKRVGITPQRALNLIVKHGRKYGIIRQTCRTRSKYKTCIRHANVEWAIERIDPDLISKVREVREIQSKLVRCSEATFIYMGRKVYMYRLAPCKLTREEIERLFYRMAELVDELGIDSDVVLSLLHLEKDNIVFYLDNGEKVELMAEKY